MQKRKWVRWLAVICCLCVLPSAPAALAADDSTYGVEPAIGFSGVSDPFSADLELYPDGSKGLLEMYMLREGDTFPILVFSSEQNGDGKPERFTLRGLDPNRQFTLVLTQRDPEESARTATFPYTNEVSSMAMRGIVMPKNEGGVVKTWHIYGITFKDHAMQAAGTEGLDAFLVPEDAGNLQKLMPNLFPATLESAPLFAMELPETPELVASVVPPAPRPTAKPKSYDPPAAPTAPPIATPSPAPVIPTPPVNEVAPTPTAQHPTATPTPTPPPDDTPPPTPTLPEVCVWCGQKVDDPAHHALCLICSEALCYGDHSMCNRENADPNGGNHPRLECGHFSCEAGNHTKCAAGHWLCHGGEHGNCIAPLAFAPFAAEELPALAALEDPLVPLIAPPVLPPPLELQPTPEPQEPESEPTPAEPEPTPEPQEPEPGPAPEEPEPTPEPQEPEPGPAPEEPEPTPEPQEPEPEPTPEEPEPTLLPEEQALDAKGD